MVGVSSWWGRISMEMCVKNEKGNPERGSSVAKGKVVQMTLWDLQEGNMYGTRASQWEVKGYPIAFGRMETYYETSSVSAVGVISHVEPLKFSQQNSDRKWIEPSGLVTRHGDICPAWKQILTIQSLSGLQAAT